MDPFIPPTQPNRWWRYREQNLSLIQQNREQVNWKLRTQSWVNDVPMNEECIDLLANSKRKPLEDLPNSRDVVSKKQRLIKTNHPGLVRRTTRMQLRSAVQKRHNEDADEAGQDDTGPGRQVQRGQSGGRCGQPAPSKAFSATPVVKQAEGGAAAGKGEDRPAVDSDDHVDSFADISSKPMAGRHIGTSLSNVISFAPPSTATHLSSSPPRSTSPSKESSKSETQRIARQHLAFYEPAILFSTYELEKRRGFIKPDSPALQLWTDFIHPAVTTGPIPLQLKEETEARFDTPCKTAALPPAAYALQPELDSEDLAEVLGTVNDVWEMAHFWGPLGVHESMRSSWAVIPLLNLPRKLKCFKTPGRSNSALDAANVSAVEISPASLRLDSERGGIFKILDRKIDFIMGLRLSRHDREKLKERTYQAEEGWVVPSINQTSACTRFTPVFLNVVIKEERSTADPLVQLAVWVAAEFKKRHLEGWDRSIPVMAVTIDGHAWDLYVVYERSPRSKGLSKLVFLGPITMGTTRDYVGMWSIARCLIAIARWGVTNYREWFRSEILSRF